jgi:putative endonuclease
VRGRDPRYQRGIDAEAAAAGFLTRLGYRILATRWRCRGGEIDLIAEDGRTVVFVEVRMRTSLAHGRPEETIGSLKRRRLVGAAASWLTACGRGRPCRFDVVAIASRGEEKERSNGAAKQSMEILHLKDAFRARG